VILEPLRLVKDWLTDAGTGVNAQLAAAPTDVGEAAPPAVTVLTELETPWVAREVIDTGSVTGPMLLVTIAGETEAATLPDTATTPRAEVGIAVRYAVRLSQTATAARDCYLTLRTVHRIVAQQFAGVMETKTRNRVEVSAGRIVRYLPLAAQPEDDLVVGALVILFPVLDPWALGIVS